MVQLGIVIFFAFLEKCLFVKNFLNPDYSKKE